MTDTAPAPRYSVVIPTFQRRELVTGTVQALAAQENAPPFEVIVVVDGSTDGTAAALRELDTPFPLTVVEQPNQGRSAACNRGAEAARGELLLFLDDDMEADPRLLAEHERSHREGADVVFGHFPLHPDSPAGFLSESVGAWAEERGRKLAADPAALGVTDFSTGQTSLPREVFRRLGGFDTAFTRGGSYGGEDFDLGIRLVRAGCSMVFNPQAVSRQRYVVPPRRHLRQWRDRGIARVMLARRYPEHAATLLARRERLTERLVWRWLRRPLAEVVLAAVAAGAQGPRSVRWFRQARDLELFAGIRAAGGVPEQRPVRVLCYHAISDLHGAGVLEPFGVPPRRFRRQLRLLARFFNFIDAREFAQFLRGSGVPRRAVLLTFDDCYGDLLDAGLPALREAHAPGLAFAVTGLLGGTNDWDAHHGGAPLRLLSADGLRELERAGVAIGAHTRTHPRLDRSSAGQVEDEVVGSLDDLEAAGFDRPVFLAYPYGKYDAEAKRIAAEAGLEGAFVTRPGLVEPSADRFELPRIEIMRRDTGLRFVLKVLGAR